MLITFETGFPRAPSENLREKGAAPVLLDPEISPSGALPAMNANKLRLFIRWSPAVENVEGRRTHGADA